MESEDWREIINTPVLNELFRRE